MLICFELEWAKLGNFGFIKLSSHQMEILLAYIINPLLEIEEQGQWRNIYEVACLEDMGEHAHPRLKAFGNWVREQRQALMSELTVQEKGE